jgi:osmotically-inducible protein OsmY
MFSFFEKDDEQIQIDVLKELKFDPSVTSTQISVTAKNGVVTLNGNVPHFFEKTSAEEEGKKISVHVNGSKVTLAGKVHSFSDLADAAMAAWNTPGVGQVVNNLRIS